MAPLQVPWVCWGEWNIVFEMLFNEPNSVHALNRIEAWAHRGRLPVAVEASAALVGAQLHDQMVRTLPASAQPLMQRHCRNGYALAIIRFVNGITDGSQKGKTALSVSSIADRLELPRHFVDLRHDATHGLLPSLKVLRTATSQAVRWLHDHYWVRQRAALCANKNTVERKLAKYAELIAHPELLAPAVCALATEVSPDSIKAELVPALLHDHLIQAATSDDSWAGWADVISALSKIVPHIPAALLLVGVAGLVRCQQPHTTTNQLTGRGAKGCRCSGVVSVMKRLLPMVPTGDAVHRRVLLACLRASPRSCWLKLAGELILAQEVCSKADSECMRQLLQAQAPPLIGALGKRKRVSASTHWQTADDWVARPMGLLRSGEAPDLSWSPVDKSGTNSVQLVDAKRPNAAMQLATPPVPAIVDAKEADADLEAAAAAESSGSEAITKPGAQHEQTSWLSGITPGKLFLL